MYAHGWSNPGARGSGVSAVRRLTRALPRCPGPRRPQARSTMDPGGEKGGYDMTGARGTASLSRNGALPRRA
eukprot:8855852-Alexandrium_andersonii.AAC.1